MAESYLYVIAADAAGPVKLGYSDAPRRRLAQLQTACADRLDLHHVEPVDAALVRPLERLLHRDINHLRRHGEWFGLAVSEAVAQLRYTLIRYEAEPDLGEKVRRRAI